MKLLIAYASNSGTCKMAAEQLAAQLPNHTVTVVDLSETAPVLGDFDYAVVGGPIRFNKAHKALRRFLREQETTLLQMPYTLFLCCAFADQFENYLEMTYSAQLLEHAEDTVYFGGELDPAKQKGIDRLLTRWMRRAILESEDDEAQLPGFLPEHVRLLADRLRRDERAN